VWEANRIVTELLDYARTQPPAPSRTTVARLLEDALAEVAPAPTIEVATEVEPDLLVEVDVRQTRDAIANVVRNALEAMPHGGRLTITAHGEAGDALIAVEDSGPGLTRSALAGVFEPLVTSKPLGLGLGLATARVLVENQRGSIRVATQRGAGARFEIRLPLARG
jgi:signal transduction histidine kinase